MRVERFDDKLALLPGQTLENTRHGLKIVRDRWREIGTAGHQQKQRKSGRSLDQPIQKLLGAGVHPVHVFEQHQQRGFGGQLDDRRIQRVQNKPPLLARAEAVPWISILSGN